MGPKIVSEIVSDLVNLQWFRLARDGTLGP
jgi:hypothetical protein